MKMRSHYKGEQKIARCTQNCLLKNRPLEVVSHLLAHAAECRINIAGALQGSLNMRQNVLTSDMFEEIRPVEQLRRLVARSAEQ